MPNHPVGTIGSWFAKFDGEEIPVFWDQQYFLKPEPHIKTDWSINNWPQTANKRQKVRDFLNAKDTALIALAKAAPQQEDGGGNERIAPEVREYIAVFEVTVIATEPEIELKVTKRVWHGR